MICRHGSSCCSSNQRRGITLLELVVSTASTMTLVAGLTSAIFIASQAAAPNSAANLATAAGLTLDEIAAELRTAKGIRGRTATSISFTVDDRSTDVDSADEAIGYAWDGIPGGSITRTYNGVEATVVTSVYDFALGYTIQPAPSNKRVLFIQGNVSGNEAGYDNLRVQTMQGWGYAVIRKTTVSTTTQTELEVAAASADVIYVSTSVQSEDLDTKLKSTPKGTILEEALVAVPYGLTTADGSQTTETQIRIIDNTHYITSPFSNQTLTILTASSFLQCLSPTYAAGLKVYATEKNGDQYPNIAILDTGGMLTDSSRAAGPRIVVPWGGDGIDPASLNANGLTLWQRALDWATGTQVLASIDVALRTTSLTGPVVQTRVELIGRPRP